MKRRLGIDSDDVARREIERNDASHSRAVQRQFNIDWRDPTGYDVVISTGRMPIDAAVALLQQLTKCGAYEPTERSREALLDRLLESRARAVLDELVADSPIGSSLTVTVRQGQATIDGVVSPGDQLRAAIDAIRKIEGVRGVANETVKVATSYGP